MTQLQEFDAHVWRAQCKALRAKARERAMTVLHFEMLLGQYIEDALRRISLEHALQAVEIAMEFGYETSSEREEDANWLVRHAPCRFGIQNLAGCDGRCEKTCGVKASGKDLSSSAPIPLHAS